MSDRAKRLSRRNFLLATGAGTVATAAAIVASKPKPAASGQKNDKRATLGYQADSSHVSNYYRTTKV